MRVLYPIFHIVKCLTKKEVHIELVTDLSTAKFLDAFKLFVSRRGQISVTYSDNGTNFMGTKTALVDLYSLLVSDDHNQIIGGELVNRGIKWELNPPHFGGL